MNAALDDSLTSREIAPQWQPPPASLALEFCGMHFASPIVLLSGCVGFGEEYTRVAGFSNRDVGAICLKGTTGKARLGNKPHRVFETPMGMLNAIGLQNPGAEAVVRDILPTLSPRFRNLDSKRGLRLARELAVEARLQVLELDRLHGDSRQIPLSGSDSPRTNMPRPMSQQHWRGGRVRVKLPVWKA